MQFSRNIELCLQASPDGYHAFSGRAPFGTVTQLDNQVQGVLLARVPVMGDIEVPFSSHVQGHQQEHQLVPLELDHTIWAQISGQVRTEHDQTHYQLCIIVYANLASSDKWGSRALQKMAETAFEHHINKALEGFVEGSKL